MRRLLEDGIGSTQAPVDMLILLREDFYLQRCRERLTRGLFRSGDLQPLLQYWQASRPEDYVEVLIQVFRLLRNRIAHRSSPSGAAEDPPAGERTPQEGRLGSSPQFSFGVLPDAEDLCPWSSFMPLFLAMASDDDSSWAEFAQLLAQGDVPLGPEVYDFEAFSAPRNPARLPILAQWYAIVRRSQHGDMSPAHDLAGHLMRQIQAIDGPEAIAELRRLQQRRAFPGAEWLSFEILSLEDRYLSDSSAGWKPGELLSFLNRESFAVVNTEHDLFEWVCQAIEDIQEALQERGEGVAGFWDGDCPKEELGCQNVLWPRLKERLNSLGVTNVEERYIGRNRCDFWVELPRPNAAPLAVAVELKIARRGYGPTRLVHPVETQLWDTYLRPAQLHHGIYVVLWFRDPERYDHPRSWASPGKLREDLASECVRIEQAHQIALKAYVVDLTARPRGSFRPVT